MKIDQDIAAHHWRAAAGDQIIREYVKNGYTVTRDAALSDFTCDFLARKDAEVVVIELKPSIESRSSERIVALRDYVIETLRGQFRVVYVSPPHESILEFEGLEGLLREFMEELPNELAELAGHVVVEDVDGLDIERISVSNNCIDVEGVATVYVEMQYGSNSEVRKGDGAVVTDSFPFSFHVSVSTRVGDLEVSELQIDTSSYYE